MVRTSNYFYRLILFCLCLSTLPVLFLGLFSAYTASGTIQDKVNEANNNVINQTRMRVEQLLKAIDNVTTQAIESPLLKNAVNQPLPEQNYKDINDLVNTLLHIQTYELRISDVELHSFKQNWMIIGGGFQRSVVSPLQPVFPAIMKTTSWVSDTRLIPRKGSYPGVSLLKSVPVNTITSDGAILVQIPYLELNHMLEGASGSGKVMILDAEYRIIGADEYNLAGQFLNEPELTDILRGTNSMQGSFHAQYRSEPVNVVYIRSTYNDWIYASIIPSGEVSKDSNAIRWATFWTCLLMIMTIIIFTLLGSKRMYLPIRKIYESVKGPLADGNSGNSADELFYIGKRIDFLINSQQQMKDLVENQVRQLQDFFVVKLFRGQLSPSEIREKIIQFDFPRWRWHAVLAIQIDTLDQTNYGERDKDLLMFAISNIAGEVIPFANRYNPILVDQFQGTLLGGNQVDAAAFREYVMSLAAQIQQASADYIKLKVSIGISQPFTDVLHTPIAFREALDALKYRMRLGEEAILDISDIKPQRDLVRYYPKHLGEELLHAVQYMDQSRAAELLSEWMRTLLLIPLGNHEYQLALTRLLVEVIALLQDEGIAFQPLQGEESSLFEQLFKLHTPEEIEAWLLKGIIIPVIEALRGQQESQLVSLSVQVIELIQEKFDTDLTLEWCAARLNYTPDYIRKVFRKETGMTFSDYLSNYRHRMARKWIAETDMKVHEVAHKLKYNNAQNFIRNFRKMEGVTPGQYRTQMNHPDEE
ncbi:helix-turn-helix domain-containing protein [Paenibacillus periandrae]|uniref:helix-turn-helix domain-containing protein n=1 Tax=Paenibacillus periandrae TaxID=1761741 RepID=UPI001F09DEF8|nr:helix-turn-helix domain-containing protein [Paenibacillus periandrae]